MGIFAELTHDEAPNGVAALVLDAPAVTLAEQLAEAQQAADAAKLAYGLNSPQHRQAAQLARALGRLQARLTAAHENSVCATDTGDGVE